MEPLPGLSYGLGSPVGPPTRLGVTRPRRLAGTDWLTGTRWLHTEQQIVNTNRYYCQRAAALILLP